MATPRQKIDGLLALIAPEIRDAFLAGIANIVDNVLLGQLVSLIEAGNFEAVYAVLGMSPAVFNPLLRSMENGLDRFGTATGETFPRYIDTPAGKTVFRFDVRNPRAEAWLRNQSSTMIVDIETDLRTVVRDTLDRGLQGGRNPRSIALDMIGRVDQQTGKRVGGVIGLTPNQDTWLQSARNRLENLDPRYFDMDLRDKRFDSTVRRYIERGEAIPRDVIEKLADRYKAAALKYRGEMIGRTEALQSLNYSEYEATLQALETGAFKESDVKRFWDSSGNDGRTRHTHLEMEGQSVGLREAFTSPSGARMMHPGDRSLGAPGKEVIACRCRVRTEIDWLAGLN